MYQFSSYLFFLNIILLMLAVRHLRYLLLDPAIYGYVGNITSWWNTKQGGRANNTDVHNSGSLYKKPGWFLTGKKNHLGEATGWHFLLDSSAWHFSCRPQIRSHSWHFCAYTLLVFFWRGHSHSMRPAFVEIVSLNIDISPSYPIFAYCDVDRADVNSNRHPGLR